MEADVQEERGQATPQLSPVGSSRYGADAAGANDPAKGQTALPTGVGAALAGNATPTVQIVTSDGLCIGATLTVKKDEGGVYHAQKK